MAASTPPTCLLDRGLETLLLTTQSRREFLCSLWANSPLPKALQVPILDSYFRYYHQQCTTAVHDTLNQTITHQTMIQIARILLDSAAALSDIPQLLRSELNSEDTSSYDHYWVFFAVRALTMIDVGELRMAIRFGQTSRIWRDGSLKEFINLTFPTQTERSDGIKLEPLFTARNLELITSVRTNWTDDLADHLRLEKDKTSVRIFSHVSFFELHRHTCVRV